MALGFTPAQEMARQHQNRTVHLRATFITLIPLSVIAVLLRLLSRRVARIKFWWDDILIVLGLVGSPTSIPRNSRANQIFALGLNAALLSGTYYGLGIHAEFAGMAGVINNAKVSSLRVSQWTSHSHVCRLCTRPS